MPNRLPDFNRSNLSLFGQHFATPPTEQKQSTENLHEKIGKTNVSPSIPKAITNANWFKRALSNFSDWLISCVSKQYLPTQLKADLAFIDKLFSPFTLQGSRLNEIEKLAIPNERKRILKDHFNNAVEKRNGLHMLSPEDRYNKLIQINFHLNEMKQILYNSLLEKQLSAIPSPETVTTCKNTIHWANTASRFVKDELTEIPIGNKVYIPDILNTISISSIFVSTFFPEEILEEFRPAVSEVNTLTERIQNIQMALYDSSFSNSEASTFSTGVLGDQGNIVIGKKEDPQKFSEREAIQRLSQKLKELLHERQKVLSHLYHELESSLQQNESPEMTGEKISNRTYMTNLKNEVDYLWSQNDFIYEIADTSCKACQENSMTIRTDPTILGRVRRPDKRLEAMEKVFASNPDGGVSSANMDNLRTYIQSDDYVRHAATAKVYYHWRTGPEEATQAAIQKMPLPTNANPEPMPKFNAALKDVKTTLAISYPAYETSVPPEKSNLACTYSETYCWSEKGEIKDYANKKEIACLTVPMPNSKPNGEGLKFLAKAVVEAAIDHMDTAFGGKGIKRLLFVVPNEKDFPKLSNSDLIFYYDKFTEEIIKNKSVFENCVISMGAHNPATIRINDVNERIIFKLKEGGLKKFASASISDQDPLKWDMKEGDLVINHCPPNALIGSGEINSSNGIIGASTGALLTGWGFLNPLLDLAEDGRPKYPYAYDAVSS